MKSVLISIQPKWCEKICNIIDYNADNTPIYEKTIEVRKTKPKLETPFKCYIYMTKEFSRGINSCFYWYKNGKVIGEFVCDEIKEITANNLVAIYFNNPQKNTCLNDLEMREYANGNNLFLWHISNLVIYDKPKELGEFYMVVENEDCGKCKYYDTPYESEPCNQCQGGRKYFTRPPQSWCYVESESETK